MYRLTLYYLVGLLAVAFLFSFFKLIPFSPMDIIISTGIVMLSSIIANFVFAKMFGAVTNVESVFITALILLLIIPLSYPTNVIFLIIASVLAMASKYLLTIEKQHIFNPAAVSVAMISMLSNSSATWWIGTPVMLPFIVIGGLLLMRKIRRETLIFSFLLCYTFVIATISYLHTPSFSPIFTTLQASIFHSAFFFFTFVMLTEPITSPATEDLQVYYSYFVAILYATPQLRMFGIALTPEIALSLGNIFSYIINPKFRLVLPLKWKKALSPDTYLFAFNNTEAIKYIPGQYMEWTLPHSNPDNRGNRRYFSLASSPTESDFLMAVKFYNPSSSYKKSLLSLDNGKPIIASQLAGDFVLPKKLNKPLVFIAGGVGIAPFRSMIQYIIDKKIQSDIILFYSNRHVDEILFTDTFTAAKQYGVRTIYTLTDKTALPQNWPGESGYITNETIEKYVPEFRKRTYYISGPQLMVDNFKKVLTDMGISKNHIKTDFFPGYFEK